MSSLRVCFAAALIAASFLLSSSPAVAGVGQGDRAAELVAAKDARGRKVKLKSLRKKVVVLTFGASWCKPCKKELPAWEKLARRYKARGVVFVAVNIDKDLATGKAFMKKAGLRAMRAAYEPSAGSVESYDPPTMPTTYVIDGRGIVRFRHAGFRSGDERTLSKQLDKLLE